MIDSPSLRPLVMSEYAARTQFSVCKCSRRPAVTHVVRWYERHYTSSRYRFHGGKESEYQFHVESKCTECAKAFAEENGLPFLPSPVADPARDQRWMHWRTSEIVTIVGIRQNEAALCSEVVFEPAVSLNESMQDALLTSGFLSEFDPVGSS